MKVMSPLAAALADMIDDDEDRPEPAALPIEGHVARLRDDCAALDARRTFRPGELVRYAPGLRITRDMGIMVFRRWMWWPWRRVEPADLGSAQWCDRWDCVVACLSGRERLVTVEYAGISRRLVRVPASEIAALDGNPREAEAE